MPAAKPLWERACSRWGHQPQQKNQTIITIDFHHRHECLPPHISPAHPLLIPPRNAHRGASIMIHTVTLAVSFPVFGSNYYAQQVVSRKEIALVFDKEFEALLMPADRKSTRLNSSHI